MADNDNTYTSNRKLNSGASIFNALSFMMENMIKGQVNTCIPVKVETCDAPGPDGSAGYVSCTPLVMQRGADGNSLAPATLPKLPFLRLQCGNCAIVADPQPGDIGLAVFAQQDCSNVSQGGTAPVQAGSFRSFDMADGFYIGGFLNNAPQNYIVMEQDGTITIKATTEIVLDAPTITLKGNVTATQNMTIADDLSADGISFNTHTHTGVHGETSGPH